MKKRLLLAGACIVAVVILFQLPKVVVENEGLANSVPSADSIAADINAHVDAPAEVKANISLLRAKVAGSTDKEKKAIFADSLASLYASVSRFDSAAWFAEESSAYFNNVFGWQKTGDQYYQAFTLAVDGAKQQAFASKAQEYYGKVLKANPDEFTVKSKLAMTYVTSSNPMQGIMMLREVLAKDPKNELALFSLGMLSVQSGQNDKAVERLNKLVAINPDNIQAQLLLGVALMNLGEKVKARAQFEKVKKMDQDPAVQSTADSYLNDLK